VQLHHKYEKRKEKKRKEKNLGPLLRKRLAVQAHAGRLMWEIELGPQGLSSSTLKVTLHLMQMPIIIRPQ
jgi:hypothetical protein